MSFPRMVSWLTVLLVFMMAARSSLDSDTWWHLRAGRWMIENRAILTRDLFSYTRYGAEWRYPGWLIEVPMALIETKFGLGGLNLFGALIISIAFAFVYATLRGSLLGRAFLTLLAAVVSAIYWSVRPHLITLLLTAVFLYLLERAAAKNFVGVRRSLWSVVPFLMLLWVNTHGGFVIGFLIWGAYFLEALVRRFGLQGGSQQEQGVLDNTALLNLFVCGLLMGGAAALNPLGWQIFFYPFETISIQTLREYIQEWQSPNFHSLAAHPFIWMLILLIGSAGFSRRQWLLRDLFMVVPLLYLALIAGRNVALFALVAPLPIARVLEGVSLREILVRYFPKSLGQQSGSSVQDYPLLNGLIVALVLLGCIYRSFLAWSPQNVMAQMKTFYPVGAVEYLKQNRPSGQLLNSYNWGAYLLWALPEYPVFVDGRTDLYGDEILEQWLQVIQLREGWERVIDRWQVRVILMEREWVAAKYLLQAGWCSRYEDEIAIVLEKCP